MRQALSLLVLAIVSVSSADASPRDHHVRPPPCAEIQGVGGKMRLTHVVPQHSCHKLGGLGPLARRKVALPPFLAPITALPNVPTAPFTIAAQLIWQGAQRQLKPSEVNALVFGSLFPGLGKLVLQWYAAHPQWDIEYSKHPIEDRQLGPRN